MASISLRDQPPGRTLELVLLSFKDRAYYYYRFPFASSAQQGPASEIIVPFHPLVARLVQHADGDDGRGVMALDGRPKLPCLACVHQPACLPVQYPVCLYGCLPVCPPTRRGAATRPVHPNPTERSWSHRCKEPSPPVFLPASDQPVSRIFPRLPTSSQPFEVVPSCENPGNGSSTSFWQRAA